MALAVNKCQSTKPTLGKLIEVKNNKVPKNPRSNPMELIIRYFQAPSIAEVYHKNLSKKL